MVQELTWELGELDLEQVLLMDEVPRERAVLVVDCPWMFVVVKVNHQSGLLRRGASLPVGVSSVKTVAWCVLMF